MSVTVEPRRRRLRLKWVLPLALITIVMIAAAAIKVYVYPRSDAVHKADVIFVLGSGNPERYELGVRLYKAGYAPNLVFSVPPIQVAHPGCQVAMTGVFAHCFVPNPPTTRGEAAELARMSEKNGWTSAIVITINPHLMRAERIVRKCNHDDLMFVGVQPRLSKWLWARQIVYQTAGFVKSMFETDCNALL